MKLKVKKLHPDAILPTRAYVTDLGYDLYALEDVILRPTGSTFFVAAKDDIEFVGSTKIRTGIALEFPEGWGGIIKDRSSLSSKGLKISGGVIDSGYTGEISVVIDLFARHSWTIRKGDKIAQLIPTPVTNWEVEETVELASKDRGSKGFGSSGQ